MKASSTDSATPSVELVRLSVAVPSSRAETTLAAACLALGAGCREQARPDGTTLLEFWVPAGRAEWAFARLSELACAIPGAACTRADEDPGWQTAMRAFHRPVDIAGRIRVRPPWHPAAEGPVDVVIDPAMAFGTGQHDTTRACLELLVQVTPGPLADIGCGSGVLAIAAAKLGCRPVWAWDLDPLAVAATLDNARVNGVALTVGTRDALAGGLPGVEVILANLTASVLIALAPVVASHAPAPRAAILSGMRLQEVEPVCAAWSATGLVEAERRTGPEWCTVLLSRA